MYSLLTSNDSDTIVVISGFESNMVSFKRIKDN